MDALIKCRSCKGEAEWVGKILSNVGIINMPDPGFLYHCKQCDLFFRHPQLSEDQMSQLYADLQDNQWDTQTLRYDQKLAIDILKKYKNTGSVLEVGCYRGDLLNVLSSNYVKYGIEPSIMARQHLDNNIICLADDIKQLDIHTPMFDAIIILDVIEHLPSPLLALDKLTKLLLPGGLLIISTGNTSALPWRILRCEYWYYYTEHVSFLSNKWFRFAASQLNLSVIKTISYSRYQGSFVDKWRQVAKALTYKIHLLANAVPTFGKLLDQIYPFCKIKHWDSVPNTSLWKDHIFVVMRSK